MKHVLVAALLLTGCHKHPRVITPATSPDGSVTNIAITPYDFASPFVCRMTTKDLTCMASIDVRFRRGQLETQIARGYQFGFHTPTGSGIGVIWFGCAAQNECGPGYFMFGGSTARVTPVDPARVWDKAPGTGYVPYGSLGIIEVEINESQFLTIRNRWAGSIAPPLIKEGSGTVVTCTDQSCTVSLK